MSTMLSDKAEQVGAGSAGTSNVTGGTGSGGGTMAVEVSEIPVSSDCGCPGMGGIASNTKQVLSDVGPAVKADAQELKFRTEDYVIEHPMKAVGIAAGVGFVLGVLWCRRR